jgi:hypothetical protein
MEPDGNNAETTTDTQPVKERRLRPRKLTDIIAEMDSRKEISDGNE